MTKKQLATELKISRRTLSVWLNETYYLKLKEAGYQKKQRILTPAILEKLLSIICTRLDEKEDINRAKKFDNKLL